jgi:hypothetical protein
MSKQQSLTPDEQEVPKHSGGSRKPRPWVLWMHLNWRRRKGNWWRRGRYATREIAETAAVKSSFRAVCEYRIMHESEGKPE